MKAKILLVDDNEFILDIMKHILLTNGYEVIALSCGDGVIDHVRKDHPDLVILDAELPDADGRTICQILKTTDDTKNLPVIMCSSRDDIKDSLKQEGAPDDVISKPFDIYFLIDRVNRQIEAAA
ncbi:response regulator [Mucilaginibacter sp. RS28]|uniref:Response regulator n=1 Tax=Mucilaginibacter straminoryzae TaxID=2932774 RepID=A0A9X1X679_9SPHI|nr:response regulator [Mucilaginibacter straminoryzae]MCJ8211721.1 response regulator [Mucilaginibacter straminoryzae]